MDTPLFFFFLFIHVISLVVGFGAVFVIDAFGLLWLARKAPLERVVRVAHVTQTLIWIGWFGLVLSGIPMLVLKGYVDNLTWIKLFLVLMVGVNGVFLHTIKQGLERAVKQRGVLPPIYEFRIAFATLVSQFGWWGAVVIGFLHRHISHDIPWPSTPHIVIIALIVMILAMAAAGEMLFRKKRKA